MTFNRKKKSLFSYSRNNTQNSSLLDTGLQVKTPRLITTSTWAGDTFGKDRLRELKCSPGVRKLYEQAFSVMVDRHLPTFAQHFAGTFASSFTQSLSMSVPVNSKRITLDGMQCEENQGRASCFLQILHSEVGGRMHGDVKLKKICDTRTSGHCLCHDEHLQSPNCFCV